MVASHISEVVKVIAVSDRLKTLPEYGSIQRDTGNYQEGYAGWHGIFKRPS